MVILWIEHAFKASEWILCSTKVIRIFEIFRLFDHFGEHMHVFMLLQTNANK